jgi:hypothetical protein
MLQNFLRGNFYFRQILGTLKSLASMTKTLNGGLTM